MARRKQQGKPFNLEAMKDLLSVEEQYNKLIGKRKNVPRYVDLLLGMPSERFKAMGRALAAYHATKLTDAQIALRKTYAAHLDTATGEQSEFTGTPAAEAINLEMFEGMDLVAFAQAYQAHVDAFEERISTLLGQIDEIDNTKYTAGITAYNTEMDLVSGNPADHPVNAGAVYLTPFKTEQRQVYWGFETHDTWAVYEWVAAMGKAIKIWDTSLTDGDTRITSQTRLRKWAHAFVRGHQDANGITALQNLAQGKVTWSKMGEGGIGKDRDLVQDVGDYKQWLSLNVAEISVTSSEEAEVTAA